MAEALGIAAGAAGFVSLLIPIISGIDTLRDIIKRAGKAPAELSSLMLELTCLEHIVDVVKDKIPRIDDNMLQLCNANFEDIVEGLEKLKKKLPAESEGMGKQKVLRIFALRHWKEDVEALQQTIQRAKSVLSL